MWFRTIPSSLVAQLSVLPGLLSSHAFASSLRGWKALDTAALRDILHAATAFGRVASAA